MLRKVPKQLHRKSLLRAVRLLAAQDPTLSAIVSTFGPPPLWEREQGFHTLIHIILGQQVSLASARAAFNRLVAVAQPLTPESFMKLTDTELKVIGFSRQKTLYGRHLAEAIKQGDLDLTTLNLLDDAEAKSQLMRIKGIGSWTADIYLLMAMGRPDIWPSGDLALAVAVERVKKMPRRPSPQELGELSRKWQPWRAVAARILWHFYLSHYRPINFLSKRN
jgi:DNA-3-methyladenine glycosylase II